jgi:hypothetical protein
MPIIRRIPPTEEDRKRGYYTQPYRPHHTNHCCIFCQWDTLDPQEIAPHVALHFERERAEEAATKARLEAASTRPLEVSLFDAQGRPILEIETPEGGPCQEP